MVYDFGLGIAECFIGRHIVETRIEISPLHESSWILVIAYNWVYIALRISHLIRII